MLNDEVEEVIQTMHWRKAEGLDEISAEFITSHDCKSKKSLLNQKKSKILDSPVFLQQQLNFA